MTTNVNPNPSSLPEIYHHAAGMIRWFNDDQAANFSVWLLEQRAVYDKKLRTSFDPTEVFRAQGAIQVIDTVLALSQSLRDYLYRTNIGEKPPEK